MNQLEKQAWRPHNPMPEGAVYMDSSGEDFDPSSWERKFYDDATYLQIVEGMPLACTDIIWVNPEKRCMYLAWRIVHSTKGPWMFGGRHRRGESPREAARRLLRTEVGTDIDEGDLHFVQTAIAISKYRAQEPETNGAHYNLYHYCYVATEELVASAQAKLEPKEYSLEHGIKPYMRKDIEAIDPNGPYGFNRAILLEEFDRIFGPVPTLKVSRIISGHTDKRRVIWDLIQGGDAGGELSLYQLAWFNPVHPGSQIGGARPGFGHYHERMWETYLILSGTCVMSFKNMDTDEVTHHTLEVGESEAPWRIEIPPRTAHRLTATTATFLLIGATGKQSPDDTFETELQLP